MNLRKNVGIITIIWSIAMLAGSFAYPGKPEGLSNEFSTQMMLGALAWLGLIFDHASPLSIFVGVSMLMGPFWGMIVLKDFHQKNAGYCAILFSGIASSITVFGSPRVYPAILGGILAPMALALFLTGFALQQAKEAAQSAAGGETDTEKKFRVEKENRKAG